MITAALLIMTEKWKQSKCPSHDEWTNNMRYIHTMEYYSSIKRNEVLTHATTWMDLENIMSNERSWSQRVTYCITQFMRNVQNKQIYSDRSRGGMGMRRNC